MKRLSVIILAVMLVLCMGCSSKKTSDENKTPVDFTVVEKESIPEELLTMIDEKKTEEFAFTFGMEGYLYIAKGYGTQATGGYSIRVDSLMESDAGISFHTTLIGPSAGEAVNKMATYPYIVIKIEYTDKNITFE